MANPRIPISGGCHARTLGVETGWPAAILRDFMEYDDIPRADGTLVTLKSFLEWQRDTLARKCAGLSAEQLRLRSAPPSTLSLLGLVRHMADVERGWFTQTLAGEDVPAIYSSEADPDGEFDNVDTADVDQAFAAWRDECRRSDEIVAARELDSVGQHRTGRTVAMRWILVHMIEEYSRHNGHADLLRERIDGATGY
jgi:uncharacterized damage-inducible protein DinB